MKNKRIRKTDWNIFRHDRLFAQRVVGTISLIIPTLLLLVYLISQPTTEATETILFAGMAGQFTLLLAWRLAANWDTLQDDAYEVRGLMIDIFGLTTVLYTFPSLYDAPIAMALKSASASLLFVYIAARMVLFEAKIILMGGVAAVLAWLGLNAAAVMDINYAGRASSLSEYFSSHKVLMGAQIETLLQLSLFTLILVTSIVVRTRDHGTGFQRQARFTEQLNKFSAGVGKADYAGQALILLQCTNITSLRKELGQDGIDRLVKAALNIPAIKEQQVLCVGRLDIGTIALWIGGVSSDTLLLGLIRRIKQQSMARISDCTGATHLKVLIGASRFSERAGAGNPLNKANEALLAAAQNKDGCAVHDKALRRELLTHAIVEAGLRNALASHKVEVHYQPVVDLRASRAVGAEALVRVRDDDGELIPPHRFIPVAEKSGLIDDLGRRVLEIVGRDGAILRNKISDPDFFISVNVAPQQFGDMEKLVRGVRRAVASGIKIKLEVTESAEIATDQADACMRRLIAEGASFAVDDFGTGFSSLQRLRALPIDTLKVDRSFTLDMETGEGFALVAAICAMAMATDKTVIIEGVETEAQRVLAMRAGIRLCQGFLFSRPIPFGALTSFVLASAEDVDQMSEKVKRLQA